MGDNLTSLLAVLALAITIIAVALFLLRDSRRRKRTSEVQAALRGAHHDFERTAQKVMGTTAEEENQRNAKLLEALLVRDEIVTVNSKRGPLLIHYRYIEPGDAGRKVLGALSSVLPVPNVPEPQLRKENIKQKLEEIVRVLPNPKPADFEPYLKALWIEVVSVRSANDEPEKAWYEKRIENIKKHGADLHSKLAELDQMKTDNPELASYIEEQRAQILNDFTTRSER